MEAIIKINEFDFTQKVWITDHDFPSGFKPCKVELWKIPDFLMNLNDLENVHIFGNQSFLEQVIKRIEKKEFEKYETNKIHIYINE